ncbi:hypothetical protein [Aequorivita sp. CIP111184]|uniref:hypothetical protein n=1 Tax=Aequorivita sp. CIP111184 TaxID=2211356 RepID=UPI0011BF986D|nr:hypothetical protein [Aequorivita sp. CIP111184]
MEKQKSNEWEKYIKRFKDFPPDHAFDAFKNEYYYEAVGVLHGFIESQLRNLLLAFSSINQKSELSNIWDINERLDFRNLSNVLFVIHLISKKEYDTLNSLNSLRNEIIHKYFYDPYENMYFGVSHKKFLSIFKPSYNLSYDLIEKIDKMYEDENNKK